MVRGDSGVRGMRRAGGDVIKSCKKGGGRDWPGRGERHLAFQEAAVHRHSLDRLNTINDSKKKKKKAECGNDSLKKKSYIADSPMGLNGGPTC